MRSPGYGQPFGHPEPNDYGGDDGAAVLPPEPGRQRADQRFQAPAYLARDWIGPHVVIQPEYNAGVRNNSEYAWRSRGFCPICTPEMQEADFGTLVKRRLLILRVC
ncbi:MAG: hypothetical protein JWL77_825 [Chthonomonadaceae bacterium]|nr:hypothetical protein [Chthonomonadaceae bacterium]